MSVAVEIPVSAGELFDKISILEIKSERISQPARLENIRHELALLRQTRDALPALQSAELTLLAARLKAVNQKIWDAEDIIHCSEQGSIHESDFLAHARIAFDQNDVRAQIKRQINDAVGSSIVEEKSYPSFGTAAVLCP